MKKVLCISLLSTAALLSVARAGPGAVHARARRRPTIRMADMPASAGAQAELKKVKSLLCPKDCGKVLLFANATTPNSATVTDGDGISKIAYSPGFVNRLQKTYGPIATFGIFAHDLGHHLEATGNRPAWMKASWDSELRADAWAGCAMAKAELTPSRPAGGAAGAVDVPVGAPSCLERAPPRHHGGLQAMWRPDPSAAGQGEPRARRRCGRRARTTRRPPGGAGAAAPATRTAATGAPA